MPEPERKSAFRFGICARTRGSMQLTSGPNPHRISTSPNVASRSSGDAHFFALKSPNAQILSAIPAGRRSSPLVTNAILCILSLLQLNQIAARLSRSPGANSKSNTFRFACTSSGNGMLTTASVFIGSVSR